MEVVGSVFQGRHKEGDFGWMIEEPKYADALFIFNDNEEQFRAHLADPTSAYGCAAGGGNAAIRPYQCKSPQKAAGVPTGTLASGGYPSLSPEVRAVIDEAISAIGRLCGEHAYGRLIFSADPSGGLGTGIFQVGDDVKSYIVQQLTSLAQPG